MVIRQELRKKFLPKCVRWHALFVHYIKKHIRYNGITHNSDNIKESTERSCYKYEEMKVEFEKVGIDANSSCCELGDSNYCDDSLDVYTPFGVSYDKATKKWMYDGKIIHVLYDEDYSLYCDSSANDGINLKVIRDKNHNIEKLVKMEE